MIDRAFVLAATLIALTAVAHGETSSVIVGGAVDADQRSALTAAVREGLEALHWDASVSVTRLAADEAIKCTAEPDAGECIAAVTRTVEAERYVVIRVEQPSSDDQTTILTGWIFTNHGKALISRQRYCERCGPDLLVEGARALATDIVKQASSRTSPATLIVKSTPTGALVRIDDRPVGATNLEHGVYAGPHQVTITKDGYRTETRQVTVEDGKDYNLDVDLQPTGDDHHGGGRRGRWIPKLVTVAGGVLVVTGGVLIALDEDAVKDGEAVGRYRDTGTAGVVVGSIGIAAVGVGLYLWLRGDSDGPTPIVAMDGNAGWLGMSGRF